MQWNVFHVLNGAYKMGHLDGIPYIQSARTGKREPLAPLQAPA